MKTSGFPCHTSALLQNVPGASRACAGESRTSVQFLTKVCSGGGGASLQWVRLCPRESLLRIPEHWGSVGWNTRPVCEAQQDDPGRSELRLSFPAQANPQ